MRITSIYNKNSVGSDTLSTKSPGPRWSGGHGVPPYEITGFLFRSDWCFWASGGARMKLRIIYLAQSRNARKGQDLPASLHPSTQDWRDFFACGRKTDGRWKIASVFALRATPRQASGWWTITRSVHIYFEPWAFSYLFLTLAILLKVRLWRVDPV